VKPDELMSSLQIVLKNEECQTVTWSLSSDNIFQYDHAETLINIFNEIKDEDLKKNFFVDLYNCVSNECERLEDQKTLISTRSAVAFYTLIKLGYISQAIDALNIRTDVKAYTSTKILLLMHDYFKGGGAKYIDINDLYRLLSSLGKCFTKTEYNKIQHDKIMNFIRSKSYEVVRTKVSKNNVEINSDKKEIIKKIDELSFESKYKEFWNEIDAFFNDPSSVESSGMIGNLRTYIENLLTDLAKKISSITGHEIPRLGTGESNIKIIRTFLKQKLELSDDDNNLIDKYIKVLHKEGGHSFVSTIEYFRLTKNMGIEIILFLLSRYEDLIIKKQKR